MTTQFVALLRGINVGGNNIIPMAELRAAVADLGARDVQTYIQSGNVLFDGGRAIPATWTTKFERGLAARFSYSARVMVRSHQQLQAIVNHRPSGFGDALDMYKYDVMFLSEALTAGDALEKLRIQAGVDDAWAGEQVLYFARLISREAQSALNKLAGQPMYKEMTVRNWRTTSTLLRMLDERVASRT